MKKLLEFAEQVFTVLSLVPYSGALLPLILSNGAVAEDLDFNEVGEVDYSLIWQLFLLNYVVTFFLLVTRWKKVNYVLSKDRFIWVLVGLAVVSLLWSSAPEMTIRSSIALVGTTLFGLYLAIRYSFKQQLYLLGWMFGISIILSVLLALALPYYGTMGGSHIGAWRGIYTHKNVLGPMMVLSAVIFLLLASSAKRNRRYLWGGFSLSVNFSGWLLWSGFSLSVSLLLLSTSISPLISFVILIAAFFVFQTLRWRYERMIPTLSVIATLGGSLYIWFTANLGTLLGLVGKDATLTGRTDLWPFVLDMIWKRPWLGYGYSGFWLGMDGESAYVWRAVGWKVPNSHNGLLDLWLDLGALGVSIFLIGCSVSLFRALAWARLSKTADGFWPVMYIPYFVLTHLSEGTILKQNSIRWVLYVAVVLGTYRQKIAMSSNHLKS